MIVLQKYQTFSKRFIAGLIDGLIFLPFAFLDNRIANSNNKSLFIGWMLFHLICWTLYVVIGHGRFGQTIGKRLMGIKVFDLTEKHIIGYKRAFLREAVWFLAEIVGIIYLMVSTFNDSNFNETLLDTYYSSIVGLISAIWLILELITMLFNNKRRALHDFIAGSVVVDLNKLQREDLQKRKQELLASLQNK